ncbi:hypothetical protein ACOMHN_055861 [Nucella lapillus]
MLSMTMYYKHLLVVLLAVGFSGRSWARNIHAPTCETDEFQCRMSFGQICIPDYWVCDHAEDCEDGEDEQNCENVPRCSEGEFMCEDRRDCIHDDWVCDSESDCEDGSDENPQTCRDLGRPLIEEEGSNEQEADVTTESPRHHGHHYNGHHGHGYNDTTAFRHARRRRHHH